MYKITVALRYLTRNWLSLIGVAAVGIGVTALISVLSVMKGFDQEFRARLRATLSDLVIESWTDDTFGDYEDLMRKIERLPHVEACAPQFEGLGLVRVGEQWRYAQFHGIDLDRELRTTDFADYWRAWRGEQARKDLSRLVAQYADLRKAPAERVAECVRRLRRDDFDLLSAQAQDAVAEWARASGEDLSAAFRQAERAVPDWGTVADPREAPAFAGRELLVLGRDRKGRVLSLDVGDMVPLVSATDIFEGRVIKRCRIVGQFKSGLYEYDLRNIYLPLEAVQEFMAKEGRVTSINVRLDSFDNAGLVRAQLLGILTPEEIREGLRLVRPFLERTAPQRLAAIEADVERLTQQAAAWFAEGNPDVVVLSLAVEEDLLQAMGRAIRNLNPSGVGQERIAALMAFHQRAVERENLKIGRRFRISTWEDKRRTFLRAVWLERRIMAFILSFIILIAGFLILAILHTSVLHKTRDIGILKAVGGTVGGIMAIFLLNGLFIGLIGCALGTAGGLLITDNINRIEDLLQRLLGFRLFPPDIYYLDGIPVDQDPFWSAVVIALSALVVSLLASAYPAWKASRMDPVEALRYE